MSTTTNTRETAADAQARGAATDRTATNARMIADARENATERAAVALERMIARDADRMHLRMIKGGQHPAEAMERLREAVRSHDGHNLARALLEIGAATAAACENHAARREALAAMRQALTEAAEAEAADAEAAGVPLAEWQNLDACDQGQRLDAAAYALAEAWAAEIEADTAEEPAEVTEIRATLAIRDDHALQATCSHHLDALLSAMGPRFSRDLEATRQAAPFAGLAAWSTATEPVLERLSLYLDTVEDQGLSHPRRVRAALGSHAMPLLAACLEIEARTQGRDRAEVLADALASKPEGREAAEAVTTTAALDDLDASTEVAESTEAAADALDALATDLEAEAREILAAATAAPAGDLLEGLGA